MNSSTKEFEENRQKVESIKNKIENEIIEIDKLYEKVETQITEYFKRKHEELIKKEKDIKDNLQIEVTKTKEKLEDYLSFSNKIIKDKERKNKGIKLLFLVYNVLLFYIYLCYIIELNLFLIL